MLYWAPYSEQLDDRVQLPTLGVGRRVLHLTTLCRYLRSTMFRSASPFPCFRIQHVDGLPKRGTVLAKSDGETTSRLQRNIPVDGDVREHLLPEFGQIVVDHGIGASPALTISSTSSSSRTSGAKSIVRGGCPRAFSLSFSRVRVS